MGGGPPGFGQGFSCPALLWASRPAALDFAYGAFTRCGRLSQNRSAIPRALAIASPQPREARRPRGLACSPFARRYSGNHFCFLFLPLLRCFNSRRSRRAAIYLPRGGRGFPGRVSPFGHPRIASCMRFPAAFRSFLRPSSAPGAKAFSLCPCSLGLLSATRLFFGARRLFPSFFLLSCFRFSRCAFACSGVSLTLLFYPHCRPG